MAEELGKIEKPSAEEFKQGRKLYFIPLIYRGQESPEDYLKIFDKYWEQVEKQIAELELKLGNINKIYHELIPFTGEAAGEAMKELIITGARFNRGDANADDVLDVADAVFTLSYLFASSAAPACEDAADANDDGTLDIADAIAVLGHLFAGAGDLPEPFGDCGVDPTADALECSSYEPCQDR